MKKCRPVVKGPSGGTLLFCFALPARGASVTGANGGLTMALCLSAACTGCIAQAEIVAEMLKPLPRRRLHGVHRKDLL